MSTHMLLQIPMLFGVGMLLAVAAHTNTRTRDHAQFGFNAYGIAGLLVASGIVAMWMVPRALDTAVEHVAWDAGKVLSLVIAGALTTRSWLRAPMLVRAFVLGNSVWMSATVGVLLVDAPSRLCTNYTTNEQAIAGYGLIVLSISVGLVAAVFWRETLADGPDGGPLRNER